MSSDADAFAKIAQALLIDYSSVYYVNAVTNEYQWYSADPEFHSLQIEQKGRDFFENMVRDANQVVYEADKHIFTADITKERLLHEMKKGAMQSVKYRLMIDGKPVYHALRLIRGTSEGDDYFILGVRNVDREVRERKEKERLELERETFTQIATSLAEHYDTIYYINMETDHYIELSSTDIYKKMNVPTEGNDFFAESKRNVDRYVHPDDQEKVLALHRKDVMLSNLEDKKSYSVTYRLVIDGEIMHCRHSEMWTNDKKHVLICVENINGEVAREESLRQSRANNVTYAQIAERLADHYDMIYYVDVETEQYVEFSSISLNQVLTSPAGGSRFFERAQENIDKVIHPDDRVMLHAFFTKELLLGGLLFPTTRQIEYRLFADQGFEYVRLSAMYTKDERHLLFCVENIDKQVRALRLANKMARTDELTGTKNKNAYQEFEESLQAELNAGTDRSFAIVVCDLNDLKLINDTKGHKVGDKYIKAASKLVCDAFSHSPVFRIGGDEFAAVLTGDDYRNREELFEGLRAQVLKNQKEHTPPVIATGISAYDPGSDRKVSDVFDRADKMMYAYKRELKTAGRS